MKHVIKNGSVERFLSPSPQGYTMHPCIVEPDQSLTIRQIYTRWRKNEPTSVHPFSCEFDDDADNIDFDEENPIDISQVQNRIDNLQAEVEVQKKEHKENLKNRKRQKEERLSEIKALADAINGKSST